MPRPTQPILSTRNITDAALDAVDATGDFTMPGIAKQLNVTPSSLYTHISGRSEIVELMRIRVMSSISVPPPTGRVERTDQRVGVGLSPSCGRALAPHPAAHDTQRPHRGNFCYRYCTGSGIFGRGFRFDRHSSRNLHAGQSGARIRGETLDAGCRMDSTLQPERGHARG